MQPARIKVSGGYVDAALTQVRRCASNEAALLDLTIPEHSYLFGFLQGDGHLYANPKGKHKGQLSVELGVEDRDLLEAFQRMIPCYSSVKDRERNTNFKEGHISSVWSVCDRRFREELVRLGLPAGRKSESVAPPTTDHSGQGE